MAKNWIAGAIKHPGALHKQLGVPQGQKIPAKKLAAARNSSNPTLAKRANLAFTLGKLHHGSTKGSPPFGMAEIAQGHRKLAMPPMPTPMGMLPRASVPRLGMRPMRMGGMTPMTPKPPRV